MDVLTSEGVERQLTPGSGSNIRLLQGRKNQPVENVDAELVATTST
jgi:hypothetical protein